MADQVFVVVYRDMGEDELAAIRRLLLNLDVPPDEVLACTPEQVSDVLGAVDL